MNITVKSVLDVGIVKRERVVLNVVRDDDIGTYILVRGFTTKSGGISMDLEPLLWFPDAPGKAGDLVVIYTKEGTSKTKVNDDGSTSHFFYLGRSASIWSSPDRAAVVAKIDEWEYYVIPPADASTEEPE